MTNVNPKEIEKFNLIASQWWDKTGPFKPLHDINPLRLSYIESKIILSGKKVLDVGCGGGILSEAMAHRGAQVLGIDLADHAIDAARKHQNAFEESILSKMTENNTHKKDLNTIKDYPAKKLSLEYKISTIEALSEAQPASFDIVTCLEMLEHVPDPLEIIKACYRLVKPNGHVFFSTINRNPKSFLFAIIGAEYLLKLIPKGTHQFQEFIKPSELAKMCREAKLQLHDIIGLTYNPLTKFYKLSKNTDVNYMIHTQKQTL